MKSLLLLLCVGLTGCGALRPAPEPAAADTSLAVKLIERHAEAIDEVKNQVADDLELAQTVRKAVGRLNRSEAGKAAAPDAAGERVWPLVVIIAVLSATIGVVVIWKK